MVIRLGRFIGVTFVAALLWLGGAPSQAARHEEYRTYHGGEVLVAAPTMRDPRFQQTVILLVRHDASGAFGLVINRVMGKVRLSDVLRRLGLEAEKGAEEIAVHYGGPVQPGAGFALHSSEPDLPPQQPANERVGVSPVDRVLRAMAGGKGPRRVLFLVGYAGWAPGQLEAEMRRGDWFTAPADEDVLFDDRLDTKWNRALD
ncbi:MAG: YqgE/AlgH family protein, partial [Candidatus Tectomicrobia bacterium]|nr:YqgE/AlgH family protein [Candidatus Tectomicrobia bacterium]